MEILFRKPINQPLELMEIENDLETIQKLIGGYFQCINIRNDIHCLCNEDARRLELKNNFYHDTYGPILGNCIFTTSDEEGDFISLNDEQMKFVKKYIGFPIKK